MFINHLIVGSKDVSASTEFYCNFLGFKMLKDDPGAKGGQVLEHDESELLLIPFPSEFTRGHHKYKIFYVFDPSGVNLEVMVKL